MLCYAMLFHNSFFIHMALLLVCVCVLKMCELDNSVSSANKKKIKLFLFLDRFFFLSFCLSFFIHTVYLVVWMYWCYVSIKWVYMYIYNLLQNFCPTVFLVLFFFFFFFSDFHLDYYFPLNVNVLSLPYEKKFG